MFNTIYTTTLFFILLVFMPYRANGENISTNRSLHSENDNIKFLNMLNKGGEVRICENMKIDMSSWKAFSPKITKLVGNGENNTIILNIDEYDNTLLFEEMKDIEIEI